MRLKFLLKDKNKSNFQHAINNLELDQEKNFNEYKRFKYSYSS